MNVYMTAIVGLIGICIGSFLNVLIARVPEREPIVHSRSKCPKCGYVLRPIDLVPILSWIYLGARCRQCHERISARYPLVELSNAVLYVALALSTDFGLELAAECVFVSALIVLSLIDYDTKILPSRVIYPAGFICLGLFVLAAALTGDWSPLKSAMAGSFGAFSFYFIVWFIAPRAMGYGDVRLSALIGLSLGWYGAAPVIWGIFAGFLYGSIIGVALMAFKGTGRKAEIPFGPFMAAGAVTALFWVWPLIENSVDLLTGKTVI